MDPLERRRLGRTDLHVTQLSCRGGMLGDLWESIPEAQADATLEAALAGGLGYFDTAPYYGLGKSEHRFGHVLRTRPRDSFLLSTKVGRVLSRPGDVKSFRSLWVGGLA